MMGGASQQSADPSGVAPQPNNKQVGPRSLHGLHQRFHLIAFNQPCIDRHASPFGHLFGAALHILIKRLPLRLQQVGNIWSNGGDVADVSRQLLDYGNHHDRCACELCQVQRGTGRALRLR
jgi:hypothetical protein